MSEKRFAMAYGGNVIEDKVEKKAYQTSTFKEDVEKVVALLNEQDEDIKDFTDKIFEQSEKIGELQKENEQLRNLIKANVFREYRGGSLADFQFKSIAYDDIVNVEMNYDAEPKLTIYCKKGTKSDIERYARVKTFNLFIPVGIDYIIKEEE